MLLNVYLLNVDKKSINGLREVSTLNSYIGTTKNFDPDGLYSSDIFGPVGSEQRDRIFSYINVKTEIISPQLALTLFELKRLYKGILSGTSFAIWNKETKDFDACKPDAVGAGTGYSFFIKHFYELTPKPNHSQQRQEAIDYFYKFRDVALSQYVLVYPAGLRDLRPVVGGGEKEHALGGLYRSIISIAKTIPARGSSSPLINVPRWKLQKAFIAIYEDFFLLIDGKKGFSRGKVTSRRLTDGTRNVLSPQISTSKVMGAPDSYRITDTLVGLHQGLRSILPVTQHLMLTNMLSKINIGNGHLKLIDPKTLKGEVCKVKSKTYDLYTTPEGVEKLLYSFTVPPKRHKAVMAEDKYLLLVYRKDDVFKVLQDIDELPAGFDKECVAPITLAELLYLSGYSVWNDYFMFVTRYPIAGTGSTYPSTIRIETTVNSDTVYELEDDWETRKEKPAISYPNKEIEEFISAMSPNSTRIKKMEGDYDGDTGSGNAIYTEEALEELGVSVTKRSYWADVNNEMKIELVDTIAKRTLSVLMGEPLKPRAKLKAEGFNSFTDNYDSELELAVKHYEKLGWDISNLKIMIKDGAVRCDGSDDRTIDPINSAGSWTNKGYITIASKDHMSKVMNNWGIQTSQSNFTLSIVKHECAHEIWNKLMSSEERLDFVAPEDFSTPYLESVEDKTSSMYREELFCEYMASK